MLLTARASAVGRKPGVYERLLNFNRLLPPGSLGLLRLVALLLLLVLDVVVVLVGLARGGAALLRLLCVILRRVLVSRIVVVVRPLLGLRGGVLFLLGGRVMLLVNELYVCLLLLVLGSGRLLTLLALDQDVADLPGEVEVDSVVLDEALDCIPAVVDL